MAVETREGLKQYCLRRLGAPLVNIDVTDEQIEDRIDDALSKFARYHYSGSEKLYYKHELTQIDIDNRYITLPENIITVIRVLPYGGGMSDMSGMFNSEYQMRLGDYSSGTVPTITDYVMQKTHFNFLSQMLTGEDSIQYNRYKDKLIFNSMSDRLVAGDFIFAECYSTVDPEEYTEVYGDSWVKKYVTSLIKQQWGMNLLKFEGATLPGDITLNGRMYYEDANEEIEKLDENLRNTYELPVDFMLG